MQKSVYGLIGKNIGYSFSKNYFNTFFETNQYSNCQYTNFDIEEISEFKSIIKNNPEIQGFNVTIPYKEAIIPYLEKLSNKAKKIGAVNVIRITKKGKIKGYNSDYYGFKKALKPLLKPHHKKALILGTGGASKGIAYALSELNIQYTFVSRNNLDNRIIYTDITAETYDNYQIIINCTPLGTSPNVDKCPDIPYQYFTKNHIAFDLIYNPSESLFLQKAKQQNAVTKNGLDMLIFQAEKSWEIWNK